MKIIPKIMFLATLATGGFIVPPARSVLHAETLPITLTIPAPVLDLSDLDVRDSMNRRVTSPQARHALEMLFVAGLNNILMKNLTPAARQILFAVSQVWHLSMGWLTSSVGKVRDQVCAWLKNLDLKKPIVTRSPVLNGRLNLALLSHSDVGSFQALISSCLSSTFLRR